MIASVRVLLCLVEQGKRKGEQESIVTLQGSVENLASFPVSPIFSTHARKDGEPGIQNHVTNIAELEIRIYKCTCTDIMSISFVLTFSNFVQTL